eukprot:TRINITY_DN2512_c0_g3_i5.p1 TRINITY_DN2512_c0_g3~~TRINITY_DN2512_c0_g3_i5.p1  ORF type:complete len:863 (+),score=271.43 TRINITY_DN2512_c0_g3_i5:25-2613(+)
MDPSIKKGVTSMEWDEYQTKTIPDWINSRLKGECVNDLEKDLSDGVVLSRLAATVETTQTKNPRSLGNAEKSLSFEGKLSFASFKKQTMGSHQDSETSSAFKMMHQRDAVSKAFMQWKALGLDVLGFRPDDIVNGNVKVILALLWKIIRFIEEKEEVIIPQKKTGHPVERSLSSPVLGRADSKAIESSSEDASELTDDAQEAYEEKQVEKIVKAVRMQKVDKKKSVDLPRDDDDPDVERSSAKSITSEDGPDEPDKKGLGILAKIGKIRSKEKVNGSEKPSKAKRSQTWSLPRRVSHASVIQVFDPHSPIASSTPAFSLPNSPSQDSRRSLESTSTSSVTRSRSPSPHRGSIRFESEPDQTEEEKDEPEHSMSRDPRDLVAREIYTTEETYMKNLDDLVLIYYEHLKDLCSENESKVIFSNIQNLRNFTTKLLEELKLRVETWNPQTTLIGDVFLKFHPFFKMYTQYCNNYEESMECLHACMKKKDFAEAAENQKKNCGGLDIESLLITPVQRIPRYMLLIKEMVKHTPDSHPDHHNLEDALNKMVQIANHVNEGMRHFQTARVYDSIVETVKGILPYMEVHRRFVMEGQCQVGTVGMNQKKEVKFQALWILLFNDTLFFASGKDRQKRKLFMAVPLNSVWMQVRADCLELITPEDHTYLIKVASEEKKKWIDAINDLVFQLTKTKSQDEVRSFKYQFSSSESIYEGEWVNGRMEGKGIYYFPNNNIYDGEWKNGRMEGYGVMTYNTGEIYEGNWVDGTPDGEGKLTAGKTFYQGRFANGEKNGNGQITWWNGDVYRGHWEHDIMDGEGTLQTEDGNRYSGSWKSGQRHGKGTFQEASGNLYEGDWEKDKKTRSRKNDLFFR